MNSKEKSEHDASKVAKFLTTDPIEIDQKVNEPIRKLLREYSHIPQEKTVEHVLELVCIHDCYQKHLRTNCGKSGLHLLPRIYRGRSTLGAPTANLITHSAIVLSLSTRESMCSIEEVRERGHRRKHPHTPLDSLMAIQALTFRPLSSYACIGQLRFLNLSLRTHPAYPQILHYLTSIPNATLLDLGCCFAQDLRQLVHDGVASNRLYGIDVDRKFLDLGFDLFLDRSTLDSHFLAVDVLGPSAAQDLAEVNAKMDIVWVASFFHLFPRPRQLKAAKTVVGLLKPSPGSMLLGRQLGSVKPGEYDVMKDGRWQFRHDVQSWTEFWEEVGRETGTRWRVEASLDEVDFGYAQNKDWGDPDMRRLLFQIVRV